MPEIELLTLARVKFIARDYVALYLDAAAHDAFYIVLYIAGLEIFKKTFIGDYAVFYALRRAVGKERIAQRIEAIGVAQNERRLMKCSGEVLALGEVDSRLAADRGIDRRQKRCRYLDESDTAQIRARRKAGYIADYSAAQSYEYIASVEAELRRERENVADCFKALVLLAVLKDELLAVYPRAFQRFERGF